MLTPASYTRHSTKHISTVRHSSAFLSESVGSGGLSITREKLKETENNRRHAPQEGDSVRQNGYRTRAHKKGNAPDADPHRNQEAHNDRGQEGVVRCSLARKKDSYPRTTIHHTTSTVTDDVGREEETSCGP